MNSPVGQEYALENINRRETSIIVRKTGMDTLVQRNGGGTPVIVEITDAVKAQLLELWGVTTPSVVPFGGGNQALLLNQGQHQLGNVANLANMNTNFQNVPIANFTPDKSPELQDEPAKRRGRPPKAS